MLLHELLVDLRVHQVVLVHLEQLRVLRLRLLRLRPLLPLVLLQRVVVVLDRPDEVALQVQARRPRERRVHVRLVQPQHRREVLDRQVDLPQLLVRAPPQVVRPYVVVVALQQQVAVLDRRLVRSLLDLRRRPDVQCLLVRRLHLQLRRADRDQIVQVDRLKPLSIHPLLVGTSIASWRLVN